MFVTGKHFQLCYKTAYLFGRFVTYKENIVLWIQYQVFSSTWHFAEHQKTLNEMCRCCNISSTWHSVNLPFCQFAILSICHFANLPFCQFAILPICIFVKLPFCQCVIFSIWHKVVDKMANWQNVKLTKWCNSFNQNILFDEWKSLWMKPHI